MTHHVRDATVQVAAATPSIGAIVLDWLDVPLTTWQVRLGVLFLAVQLAYLARKWWREERPKRRTRPRKPVADACSVDREPRP